MATTISNLFSFGTRHERLPTHEATIIHDTIHDPHDEEAAMDTAPELIGDNSNINNINNNINNNNNNSVAVVTTAEQPVVVETVSSDEDEEAGGTPTVRPSGSSSSTEDGDDDVEAEEEEDDEDAAIHLTATIPRSSGRAAGTVTLSELEEERELARRRTSACVLLAVFVLFRLWVEALQNGDVFVMMLCLFGTSWTARLIRHNREREEALDERIRVYLENADPNTTEIDRNDLRFLSFQAQLALAMMESQRQMQMGGYGHPDGQGGSSGVSEVAKKKWEHFAFKEGMENDELNTSSSSHHSTSSAPGLSKTKGGYGSVAQKEQTKGLEEDGPHCSICLGEYEEGEKLVRLPCGHIYHDDCVSSWTSNHTRCPLCNYDLESVTSTEATVPPEDSIV